MRTKFRRVFESVLPFFFGFLIISALVYSFFLLKGSASYFDNEAKAIAQGYLVESNQALQNEISAKFSDVKNVAAKAASVSGSEQIDEFGQSQVLQYGFVCLVFLKDGMAQYSFGEGIGSVFSSEVQSIINSGKFAVSETYRDPSLGELSVAVYCPVYGNEDTDGLLVYYPVSALFEQDDNADELSKYRFIIGADGEIIKEKLSDNVKSDVSHNIFTYLYNITESKNETQPIENQIKNKVGGASLIHIDGNEYVAASMPVSALNGNCFVLSIFASDDILFSEYKLYDKVMGVTVFIAFFSILALILSIIIMHSDKKKMLRDADIDPVLGCNTYKNFLYESRTLLEENRFAKYAVVYFNIYKFYYFREQLGTQEAEAVLKFVSGICKQMTDANESFGHVVDDSFVMMVHYTDMAQLGERIKLMNALISNYNTSKSLGMDVKISAGIFLVQPNARSDVQKMIECAEIALEANEKFIEEPYTVYDNIIASQYLYEAELEAKMKSALKNGDFKLFFQPKYSIAKDRIDSAEVLVRWYDEKIGSYIAPDSFIHLFEANGFVSELDHYVFEETCRFLSEFTSHGEKTVPLSVNVSRATAIKADFLNFYIEKKKEYGIADRYITLEFTESFAAESYDLLENLLNMLRNNGFKCAIDDFGMGNSSLIAVKELPIDELKFDRALIKHGNDSLKDDTLLKMLFDVSKDLGMTVTQEGVETREDLNRVRALGCDLVQGYYYAKPMHTIDFVDFMKEDTSLEGLKNLKGFGK